jgi:hypothetical protein
MVLVIIVILPNTIFIAKDQQFFDGINKFLENQGEHRSTVSGER